MLSIFSTQNLQTFLRRKNLRPPSRGGPPGPRPPPPPPPKRGRSPPGRSPLGRSPKDRGACASRGAGASPAARSAGAGAFVSSAMVLLKIVLAQKSVIGDCSNLRICRRQNRGRGPQPVPFLLATAPLAPALTPSPELPPPVPPQLLL